MVKISLAKSHHDESIRELYRQCGYGGGLNQEDDVLIAQSTENIVGAVRLCPDKDFCVLRGMQVLPSFQRQGIGTQLLLACAEQLSIQSITCYCIPWEHLHSFYLQVGFKKVSSVEIPFILRERFRNYLSKEMKVILMVRLPPL